jgi:carboxyl-terminal processing protease
MKIFKTRLMVRFYLIVVLILSASFFSFKYGDEFKIVKNLDIFYNLFRELNLYYVDETNPEQLIEDGIDGMLDDLDPYTSYISPDEAKDFKFQTTGQYGGIGALIRKGDGYAMISQPYKGFPASKAGFIAGDTITQIDGKSIEGKNLSEVSELLKGIPGTNVTITIKRPYIDSVFEKKVTREEIQISAVPFFGKFDDKIGYIRLRRFTRGATDEVRNAVEILTKEQDAASLIIDLRNNPGGLLDEAIKIAGLFVEKGQLIVWTKGKVEKFNKSYYTSDKPINKEIPLVIMVNSNSASASEIIAGAMQDLDRAVVVGEQTYGKGLVQSTRPLSYGAQLKVTTAKYYIPSGRSIQSIAYNDGNGKNIPDSLSKEYKTKNGRIVYDQKGIEPDVVIKPEELSQISASLYTKNMIFDFATLYRIKHDSILPVNRFFISDSLYKKFKSFINKKNFSYQTMSEEKLNELIETAKQEKYFKLAEAEFDDLEKKLAHNKEKDLQTFRNEITELLKEEIIQRYYYEAGRIEAAIHADQQIDAAINVLDRENVYSGILSGAIKKYKQENNN